MKKSKKNRKLWVTAIVVYIISISLTFLIEHLEHKTSGLNPIHIFFRDFDFTDIYYHSHSNKGREGPLDEILIVNSMCSNRQKIARLIRVINEGRPAVIGVDYFFEDSVKNKTAQTGTDSLNRIFDMSDNLVIGFKLPENRIQEYNAAIIPGTGISRGKNQVGFLNLANFEGTIRKVPLNDARTGILFESFSMALAKKYLNSADDPVIRKLEKPGIINQFRISYLPKTLFKTINGDSLLLDPVKYRDTFKDKIVLLGETENDENLCGYFDKHFTPLNPQLGGKSYPDMEGVYIHANILRTILNANLVFYEASGLTSLIISLIFCFPIITLLLIVYCRPHHIFHFFMVLVYEPLVYFAFILISIYLYSRFIYVPLKTPYILLSISPFVLYIIDLADIWLNRLLIYLTGKGSPSYFTFRRVDHFLTSKKSANEEHVDPLTH